MRRWIPALLTALLVCGPGALVAHQAHAQAPQAKSPINIGGIFDLSGVNVTFGKAYYDDAKIVFDYVNKHGGIKGHKLNVRYLDDGSDAAKGVEAARQLIDRDHVQLMYGGTFTPVALAIATVAQQSSVAYYTPASSATALTTPVQKYVFAANQTAVVSSKGIVALVASIVKARKIHKIGFIQETDAYGQQGLTAVQEELAKHNLKIDTTVSIAADATDATSQVVGLKNAGVDVVVSSTTINPATAIVKAASQQGLRAPIVAFGGGSAPAIDQLLTSSAPIEYYGVTPLACALGGKCTKSFLKTFGKAFPNDAPSVWTAQGYAAAWAFVKALRLAKNYTANGVVAALEKTTYTNSVIPYPIKFSRSNHLGIHNTYLYGFKSGKLYFFGNNLQKNALKKKKKP
jgi:branched-chain amino acid transport system substrate-binding protein